jgi:hypothetical protein
LAVVRAIGQAHPRVSLSFALHSVGHPGPDTLQGAWLAEILHGAYARRVCTR